MWLRVATWASAAVLAVAAAALAWSVGVLTAGDTSDPDYFWRPIEALVDLKYLVLFTALVIGGLCLAALAKLRGRGAPVDPLVVLPVVLIGAVAGGSYSVLTAPVIGANIGAGLVVFAGPIVILVLAAWAVRSTRTR